MGKLIKMLALTAALTAAPLPAVAQTPNNDSGASLSIGLSSPCHGLLALRGVYDFNDKIGVQADFGIGFSGIDFRYKPFDSMKWLYGYAGVLGVSPWMYALAQSQGQAVDGPVVAAEVGAGIELGGRSGLTFGIEGGLVLPIPTEPNTGFFRFDLNLMYKIPMSK